ncbi:GNAT family N-acetyltransferase [Reinekea marina]|uniref:Aminoglycoside N(6')-acetyltransferase type 1 n=1 Tax=Reinekea marina TaxID=1310421 RepID=A0ABV7WTJ5_9GAMM|nr:aminoglycoside 6'-N-acetyltransferase [Reinekea marina]MDN3649066.1 GNAT family N-acetyltransferase [Reinekea marina]
MDIRVVNRIDIGEWAELRNELWPSSVDQHKRDLTQYFQGKSTQINHAYLSFNNGEIVGFIELNVRNYAEGSSEPRVPFVEGWYVKPDFQGTGIGKALMEAAEQWAIKSGYHELASDTEFSNEKSIALHKELGFKEVERVVCFLKKL